MKTGRFFAVMVIGWVMLSSISFGYTYSGGNGDPNNPYQISDANDLNAIGLHSEDWGKCFILTDDIDMSGVTGTQYNIIGDSTIRFMGTFDGHGYKICNLTYDTTVVEPNEIGLFGWIDNAAIRNLDIENIIISIEINSVGDFRVGGLAGRMISGTITNCCVTGLVTLSCQSSDDWISCMMGELVGMMDSGTIMNCYSASLINFSCNKNISISGLVGCLYSGDIINCYNTSSISSDSSDNGTSGLVGWMASGNIMNCYNTGSITSYGCTGGLVRVQQSGTIANCYNTGSVTSFSQYDTYVGGLVGYQHSGTVTNCFNTGSVNCSTTYSSYAGGLIGGQSGDFSPGGKIEKCYSTGPVSATGSSILKGGILGYRSGRYGTVIANFWDTQTSGTTDGVGNINPDPAGVTGKTTAEMQTLSTFTSAGWDFTTVWDICQGTNYPRLQWQIPAGDFACPDGVSVEDLDYFVGRWLLDNCTSSNDYCGGGDINASGTVDLGDLFIFAGHWMEGV